ncbi:MULTISPECIES: putative bifunctional diguanylate cyclase/phosphodiesterase [Caproicibacterium]|uniref:GGDEF domain-containing phosphodiesterase n=1 Tax=Caproicibacterium argilliputei TaxID=3030016 RepID=A0AA97D6R8_9FIRM|nr:GGDEF domain-containing phosphodiesterase [Caproicibacterium argilliputei]WOC31369.1 GGDEF domain-containing phosphodiesterase [Caproicibacterium argilliputei]
MEKRLPDMLDILTYVRDAQTYELLYWNSAARCFARADHIGTGENRKCYKALYGRSEPCTCCTADTAPCFTQQYTDAASSRRYLMRGHSAQTGGRRVEVVTGTDITGLPLCSANSGSACALAERDTVTGLYSQTAFCQRADQLRAAFPQAQYVYIRTDLNKFRIFNDAFGIQEGDRLLAGIARMLRQQIGPHDCCGHMFADVFCLMVDFDTDEAVIAFLDRIGSIHPLRHTSLLASTGIYRPAASGEPSAVCLEKAGFAHKFAKVGALPHYRFYDEQVRQQQRCESMMEFQMEDALQSGQFVVYLQPKYDLLTQNVVGAEALVRWNHPTLGLIPPDRFIPLFERNGFILKLDAYIWQETCRLQRLWLDHGLAAVPISVNVSRLHLCSPQFCSTVLSLTSRYRLSPKMLELELTESLFVQDINRLTGVLQTLRSDGFAINMDDFGSGYSSLNFLDGLEVDVLKLDCGFLKGGVAPQRSRTILRHMIAMARELGLRIVTEGVETPEQAQLLLEYGCDIIQGFYVSRPIPAEQFAQQYLQPKSA